MGIVEAIILGIVQGLTEFLPVSSSGHIELGKVLLGTEDVGLAFSVLVHVATALASVIVFRDRIIELVLGLFKGDKPSWNYAMLLVVSAVPVAVLGLLFEDQIDAFFQGNIVLVGAMLLVTAFLLFLTMRVSVTDQKVGWKEAIIIGLAQAFAVLPGVSRSGSTIATALLLKVDKQKAAEFSFLMVLIPIFGKALLDAKDVLDGSELWELSTGATLAGFLAAFISGLMACVFMLRLVKKGKLYYFSIYCAIVGIVAIAAGLM